jgi:hypothetical protein
MGFMDRVKDVADKAADAGGAAVGKLNELLDEYKKGVAALREFGFSVGKFQVEMGILPKVKTSITGSIASLQEGALKKTIDEHHENKLVVAMLNALLTAKGFYDQVELTASSVTLHVDLGLPPGMTVQFE